MLDLLLSLPNTKEMKQEPGTLLSRSVRTEFFPSIHPRHNPWVLHIFLSVITPKSQACP